MFRTCLSGETINTFKDMSTEHLGHIQHIWTNLLPSDLTCSTWLLEGCFLAILQFPFSPWKNTQKHRFELSILNFWAPRNLIRNIVPLILKSLGSQRSNHQHQHLKVSVFHPIFFHHFQYFPIFHFWDDLRDPWSWRIMPIMQPALL